MTDRVDQFSDDEALFVAYLDDDLSPEERDRFEARLEQEPELADAFARYRSTVELLRQVGPVSAPESLLPSVQRRLSSRTMRAALQPQLRFPYEVLVVTALIAGIFYLYFGLLPSQPTGISKRVRPAVVEIHLEKPLSPDFEARHGLVQVPGKRPSERAVYVTLPRLKAVALLAELEELAGASISPPKTGAAITILVTMPPPG